MPELFKAFYTTLKWWVIMVWGLMAAILFARDVRAAEYHLLEPTYVAMEMAEIANNRDTYLSINDKGSDKFGESNEWWTYGAAVDLNYNLVRYNHYALYWDNNVHMAATNVAVREVGWEYELGVHLKQHIDVFWYHHSQHILDTERKAARFPLENMYGVRFILVETGRK